MAPLPYQYALSDVYLDARSRPGRLDGWNVITYINGCTFTFYISMSESRIHGRYHSHFALKRNDLISSGFCIEYVGNPNKKCLGFDDRVVDLSTDKQINILTTQAKEGLTKALDQIDHLDENFFSIRSSLRISENGIDLNVSCIFESLNELNAVYAKVIAILKNLKTALSET